MLHGTIRNVDFSATQRCNIGTLCCVINRRCESSLVRSPSRRGRPVDIKEVYQKRDARAELFSWLLKGVVTRDDSQRRFLAQDSFATLLRHCFEWLQHCSSIVTLCCAKNRRCESSRVEKSRFRTRPTKPIRNFLW